MTFTGIPIAALDFYEDLENDNSKAFWLAHKHIYDESVRAPLEALATELEKEFGAPKFFRPYRDVRFAKDKTPYKDHQGVYFAETRRYLHVSAAGIYASGGIYEMASDQVDRYRRAVDDDVAGRLLEAAIAMVDKAKLAINGHRLTRVPAGYDKEHERAELLKHKSLYVTRDFGCPDWLPTPKAKTELVKTLRTMQPLIDWLNTHVGPSDLPVARKGQA